MTRVYPYRAYYVLTVAVSTFAEGLYVTENIGRSERIRTSGPCLPKTVLYQAELHSDRERADSPASAAWQGQKHGPNAGHGQGLMP